MSEEMPVDWEAIAGQRLRLLDAQDAEHGKQAAEVDRLRQVAMLEGIERKSALATARQAIAKAGRVAELEDENARLRALLAEAVEFIEQDYHCLTPAGEAMAARWRAGADPSRKEVLEDETKKR